LSIAIVSFQPVAQTIVVVHVGDVVFQSGSSEPASVGSVSQIPDSDDEGCVTTEPERSYIKKPLPPVKTAFSRAFKWNRSHSVENIPQSLNVSLKPDGDTKTKTAAVNTKGIHQVY